jgi:hypothetical protein
MCWQAMHIVVFRLVVALLIAGACSPAAGQPAQLLLLANLLRS